MGLTEDIENKVRDYLDGNYDEVELEYVPTVDNVSLGKKYVKTKLCALFIDLRNSSELLINRWKQTSAKIHKAYLTVVIDTVKEYDGKVRSFQGDGVLCFWPAYYKSEITRAVKTAMILKWLLGKELKKHFEEYFDIDFGIGLHWDEAYIIRAGSTDKKENNDLVYISKAVNKAVVLADRQKSTKNIGISSSVYSNLERDRIFSLDDYGNEVNMWDESYINWLGETEKYYQTSWYTHLR